MDALDHKREGMFLKLPSCTSRQQTCFCSTPFIRNELPMHQDDKLHAFNLHALSLFFKFCDFFLCSHKARLLPTAACVAMFMRDCTCTGVSPWSLHICQTTRYGAPGIAGRSQVVTVDAVNTAVWAQLGIQLARAESDAHQAAEDPLALCAGAPLFS